ncbi:hypothetical protein [Metabacillus malikii]|uniref:Uncharacterized protein n=1 Tax=Metabacillus malikii TaxID=1504265 RepID=A0ABT9ZLV4_9BACI|nr:hypothetical protein [Metabacillus malikii]MDQ0233276.1 hypothetical protein [Metabacillus malikii]
MAYRNRDSDIFKQIVKKVCKIKNLSPQNPKFETIDNSVVISVKNHLKDGIDLDCFHILNIIYQLITPLGVKFTQQLYLYPNSNRVARVTIQFTKEEYDALNNYLHSFDIGS